MAKDSEGGRREREAMLGIKHVSCLTSHGDSDSGRQFVHINQNSEQHTQQQSYSRRMIQSIGDAGAWDAARIIIDAKQYYPLVSLHICTG